ncbi:MAG: arylsulfatase [Rhodospirillaceae bacterium]|nr:arylsulfatase [Rhodospirillaceae bacterium]
MKHISHRRSYRACARSLHHAIDHKFVVGFVAGGGMPACLLAALALAIGATPEIVSAQAEFGGPARRPNVVLVLTDDQGYGDLGVHGHPVLRTPNIDAFAREAIGFSNFHVSPTCSPARAALLTGRDSNRTGVWHTAAGRGLMRRDEVTIAGMLQSAGYATGIFGKWHLGSMYPFRASDRGFEEGFVLGGGGGTGNISDFWNNTNFDPVMNHNGQFVPTNGYITDTLFDEAMQFIDASSEEGRPFFVYLPTNAPHAPFNAPAAYAEQYADQPLRMAHFLGMIENIDENFGRLRRHLRESGLEENTILMFMTDNGTGFGQGLFNAGMRGIKGSEYDGGHRVPLFLHWPAGDIAGPRTIDELTAHIDLAPTLLDLAGIEAQAAQRFDGVSLRRLLEGREADWPDRSIIVDSQRILHPEKWRKSSVMTRRWRLVNGTELYDMETDPGQSLDVAGQHQEVVSSLRSVYERWWNGIEPTFADTPRIVIGSERQYMTRLVTRECLSSGLPAWSQSDVRIARDRAGNDCTWAVDVERAGEYIVELRRWPRELNHPIRGSVPPGEPVPGAPTHRNPPGAAYAAVRATLTIGSDTYSDSVGEHDRAVLFGVSLDLGPTAITATFEDEDGKVVPSYYVYVYPRPSAATLAVESRPISSSGPQGWWQVDLGDAHDIESIMLTGCEADDCGETLSDFYVFVAGEDPVGRSLSNLARDPGMWRRYFIGEAGSTLAVPVGAGGRYVRVQHAREGVPPFARVEVRGTPVRAAGAGGASSNGVPVFADENRVTHKEP